MTSESAPRRRSLVDKLLKRNNIAPTSTSASPSTTLDPETQSTTGLISTPHPETRTLTLPLEGGGFETLVVPNDQKPRDPSTDDGSWKYRRGSRKASVPASDVGENTTASTDVEKARFASLMKETQGMTPEEVKEFLKKRGGVDGAKVMRRWDPERDGKEGRGGNGKGGDSGYMQLVGPDAGNF